MKEGESARSDFRIPSEVLQEMKSLSDVEHLFKNLYKQAVEAMLEAEMTEHLGYDKHAAMGRKSGNSRNGSSRKTVKTESVGDVLLNMPRDRESSFEPIIIPKHKRVSGEIEQRIIGLYATSMSCEDIRQQVQEFIYHNLGFG